MAWGSQFSDWPMLGRVMELATGATAISGGGLVLSGAPGVGRTRLAREMVERAGATGRPVEWVAATRAAASVPFGAVAHLLAPGERARADRFDLLRGVTKALTGSRAEPLVLGVDDAHLLDEGSAALFHQLAVRETVVVVATVRAGAPVPDAITALWKDGPARLLRVKPLADETMDRLMDETLFGPVEPASRREIRRIAAGNPLVLRLLLAGALEDRTLMRADGEWRWNTGARTGRDLAEWVKGQLAAMPDSVRVVVEVLACGEPLPITALNRLIDDGALSRSDVAEAERSGLILRESSGRGLALRPAHPAYGEVIRAMLPVGRARQVFSRLDRSPSAVPPPARRPSSPASPVAHRSPVGRPPLARSSAAGSRAVRAQATGHTVAGAHATGAASVLTPREREIAFMAAVGLSSKTIADRLRLSVRTVNNHLGHTYTKLGITGRNQLPDLIFPIAS